MDGAGVDLLALVQLRQQAPLFQCLCADGGDVHQGLGPLGGLLLAVDLLPGGQIPPVGLLDGGVLDVDLVQVGGEGGVAAVVGPVGVHQPHLGDGGVPALRVPEVGLEEGEVVQVHGEAQLLQQGGEARPVQAGEAGEGLHHGGRVVGPGEGLRLVQRGLPALHGVDEVAPDPVQVLPGEGALQEIDLGAGYQGPLHAGHQGDALGAGVGPLVKLARQGLHRQQGVEAPGLRKGLVPGHVHLGLGEDDGLGPLEDLPAEALHVVAVEDPHAGQRRDAQKAPEIREQVLRLRRHAGALFHVYTIDHHFPSFIAARARRPMSRRQKALSKWIRSARA